MSQTDSKNIEQIFEQIYNFDIFTILKEDLKLTFLAGAGISVEKPSNVATARQIMHSILQFGASDKAFKKLCEIKDLRYEYLIEEFRDNYDHNLTFLDYFDTTKNPNLIHHFLVDMIKKGNFVLTTNFDYLIEYAMGLKNPLFKVIISKTDFELFNDPSQNLKNGFLCLYKIHGSSRNILTNEKTIESVITTLDSFSKYKEGEIFSVEYYKKPFYSNAVSNRTLIIFGYSGGDDFDIIPTIMQLNGVKKIIWISHVQETNHFEIFRVTSYQPKDQCSRDEKMFHLLMQSLGCEIMIIKCNTKQFIETYWDIKEDIRISSEINYSPLNWLKEHFSIPEEGQKLFFSGVIFEKHSLYSEALEQFELARLYYEAKNDIQNSSTTLNGIARCYFNLSENKKALEIFELVIKFKEKLKDQKGLASALNFIALIYMNLGKIEKAIEIYEKLQKIATAINEKKLLVDVLGNLGSIYKNTGKPQLAFQYSKETYELAKEMGALTSMAIALGNLGLLSRRFGDYEKALEYLNESLKLLEKLGNNKNIGECYINLGIVYLEKEEYLKASEFFQTANKIGQNLNDNYLISQSLTNLGSIYFHELDMKKALENYLQAYKIGEQLQDFSSTANRLLNIGVIYNVTGNFNLAMYFFRQSLRIKNKLGDIHGMATILYNIAAVEKNLGNFSQAFNVYNDALKLFEQVNDMKGKQAILERIKELNEKPI